MNTRFFQGIGAFAATLLTFHVLLSYKFHIKYLSQWGLENTPSLNRDDLMFPFGSVNLSLSTLVFLGFLFIMIIELFISPTKPHKFTIQKKSRAHRLLESILDFIFDKLTKPWRIVVLIIVTGLYAGVSLYLSIRPDTFELNNLSSLGISYTIFLISGVLLYFGIPKKRTYVLGLYLLFMVGWAFKFIDYSYENSEPGDDIQQISFCEEGTVVTTDGPLDLVFYGNKKIILKDSFTGKYQFFNTDQVKGLEYWTEPRKTSN